MRTNYAVKQAFYLTCAFGLFATIAIPEVAFAAPPTQRFLPAAPFGFGTLGDAYNYGANLTNFDQNALDHALNIGNITFDYNTYGGLPGGVAANFNGGGVMAGKFIAAPDVALKTGYSTFWVQTVTSTISGQNEWGAANGTEFPDTQSAKTDPQYPFQTLPSGAAATQNSANFQDFPNRSPQSGNQTWIAELALVAENPTTHNAHVIESMLWGFGITNANPGTIANITPTAPSNWGAPTASFMATERNSFDGTGGSTLWTFDTLQAFVTPEPGAIAMGAAGLCLFTGYGWRRNRKKRASAAWLPPTGA